MQSALRTGFDGSRAARRHDAAATRRYPPRVHRTIHVEDVARAYAVRLRDRFGARFVDARLFGSAARGELHEDSDIDVVVRVEGATHADKVAAIEIGAECSLVAGLRIAPIVMSPAEWARLDALGGGLAREIARDGVPL